MMSRRSLLIAGGTAAVASGAYWMLRQPDHEAAVSALWSQRDPATFAGMVHYATLAANSHNSQPWKFRETDAGVSIMPDLSRSLPAADADNHHLFSSLGCAAENLILAAGAAGRSSAMRFVPAEDGGRLDIALGRFGQRDPLFDTIIARQCTRSDYDGRTVSAADQAALEAAAKLDGVRLLVIEDRGRIEQVLELILAANTAQVSDPAFVAELKSWLRFNARDAIRTGDGLYSATSGNPTLPAFLGRAMFGFFFTPQAENDRYARQVRSSSGLAMIVSDQNYPAHWVQAGRSYQRFALQATRLGIRHAHLNQPVEVPEVRQQLKELLGLGNKRPDLVLRYGYAPPMPRSLRRPVESVISVE